MSLAGLGLTVTRACHVNASRAGHATNPDRGDVVGAAVDESLIRFVCRNQARKKRIRQLWGPRSR